MKAPMFMRALIALLITTFTLVACTKKESKEIISQIPNGEVVTIKSATPERDFSLFVVADRDDFGQKDMEFYVSAESPADLHDLIKANVGKKVRISLADGLISAAEELEGSPPRFAGSSPQEADSVESATSIQKIFGTKWQMAENIPCDKDGGTYFIYDREFGNFSVFGGSGMKPERKPKISISESSDSVVEMSIEMYATPYVESNLGERDVIASYVDSRLQLQEDGSLKVLTVRRSINFDAMTQGRKQYDDPESELLILTACP